MASAEKDLRYNCFGVRASRVQTLNTVAGVVTCIGLCNCFQTLVTQGLPGVVLSSIERRFSLPSTQSSWIASSYEVASIPVLLLLSFFGSRCWYPSDMDYVHWSIQLFFVYTKRLPLVHWSYFLVSEYIVPV